MKPININSVQEAEDILKAAGTEFLFDEQFYKAIEDEIEKAHNVGDLFFYNGKQYIWYEYSPGKFDWRLVKPNKIIKGIGINGKHGVVALTAEYQKIDKSFDNPVKMMLKRTPNGHWRLHYDSNDTGHTVDGNCFTEQELKADNICYQDRKVVDNFELLKDYMEFNSPDDVYFLQIIKRWKDNKDKPDADAWKAQGKQQGTYHSGAEYLNHYLIHSPQELDNLKSEIMKICSYNNARAYISINSRSQSQVQNYLAQFKSRFASTDPRYKHAEAILYGQAKTGPSWKNERFKVLLDIDTTRDANTKMKDGSVVNIWDETRKRLQKFNIKIAAEYETPSGGLHLILNNKNNRNLKPFYAGLSDFDGGRNLGKLATVHPSEDIKMVLYSSVDTAGY